MEGETQRRTVKQRRWNEDVKNKKRKPGNRRNAAGRKEEE
jgi:hypothetical protein